MKKLIMWVLGFISICGIVKVLEGIDVSDTTKGILVILLLPLLIGLLYELYKKWA